MNTLRYETVGPTGLITADETQITLQCRIEEAPEDGTLFRRTFEIQYASTGTGKDAPPPRHVIRTSLVKRLTLPPPQWPSRHLGWICEGTSVPSRATVMHPFGAAVTGSAGCTEVSCIPHSFDLSHCCEAVDTTIPDQPSFEQSLKMAAEQTMLGLPQESDTRFILANIVSITEGKRPLQCQNEKCQGAVQTVDKVTTRRRANVFFDANALKKGQTAIDALLLKRSVRCRACEGKHPFAPLETGLCALVAASVAKSAPTEPAKLTGIAAVIRANEIADSKKLPDKASRCIRVGNLVFEDDEQREQAAEELRQKARSFGEIERNGFKVPPTAFCAFITYKKITDAVKAQNELNGALFRLISCKLLVDFADDRMSERSATYNSGRYRTGYGKALPQTGVS